MRVVPDWVPFWKKTFWVGLKLGSFVPVVSASPAEFVGLEFSTPEVFVFLLFDPPWIQEAIIKIIDRKKKVDWINLIALCLMSQSLSGQNCLSLRPSGLYWRFMYLFYLRSRLKRWSKWISACIYGGYWGNRLKNERNDCLILLEIKFYWKKMKKSFKSTWPYKFYLLLWPLVRTGNVL